MTHWIEFDKEELEALRSYCFKSLFAMEEIAYSGIESGHSAIEQHQALNVVKLNHALISKLSVH